MTAKRKEAYLRKHPETGHGGDRASRQVGDLDSTDRFTKETADRTGQSERTIQRNAERGEKVTPAALAMVPMPPICPRHDTGE